MELERFFFWQDWSAHRQKIFFAALLVAWGVALFMAWSGFSESQSRAARAAKQSKQKYNKTILLANQLRDGESSRGALVDREPITAAQQVARDLGLDGRMTYLRPVQSEANSGSGVQIVLESLNLPEVVALMRDF